MKCFEHLSKLRPFRDLIFGRHGEKRVLISKGSQEVQVLPYLRKINVFEANAPQSLVTPG